MNQLFEFINESTSTFHAVKKVASVLEERGFEHLEEMDLWKIRKGGRYYVTRNMSGIIAFAVPEETPDCYHITASHSDSPGFRIKKSGIESGCYKKAEVENYGGMIMPSWLDRPLSYAGRILVDTGNGIESRLISADSDVFVIPNLAIHFNREINKGYAYNPQIDMQPVYGGRESDFLADVAKRAGVSKEEIADMDLFLYVRQPATFLGVEKEYFMAPRIDDLAGACASLEGYLQANLSHSAISVFCMFDNEEVGSGTRQGALSNFLPEVVLRIEKALGISEEEGAAMKSRSLLLSVDNAHAQHPNHASKSDPEFPVDLNGGIVIKYNASQSYTTTGLTAAVFADLCEKQKIKVQKFANRADSPGGSTLGNLLGRQFSVPMLDIGMAQLAMHSAVETSGCKDYLDMKKGICAFYESDIKQVRDGKWQM